MSLDETLLARLTLGALVATALVGYAMARAGRDMRRSGGPGIVPFELAETPREVRRILRQWGATGTAAARRSLKLDFAFLAAYGTTLTAAALYVAARADRRDLAGWHVLGLVMAALATVAALLDAVENVVLLRHLDDRVTTTSVDVARLAAQVKFALCGVVVLVLALAFGALQLAP